jgi:hypothetical protein
MVVQTTPSPGKMEMVMEKMVRHQDLWLLLDYPSLFTVLANTHARSSTQKERGEEMKEQSKMNQERTKMERVTVRLTGIGLRMLFAM